MAQLFFGYFAGVIALTAVLVVALRNPVYSALSLLILFFHVAGLYATLHAEFLAAVQLIVYAGAILVLYLFVVMLLNLKQDDRYHHQWRVAAFVCVPLLLEFLVLLAGNGVAPQPSPLTAEQTTVMSDNTMAIHLISIKPKSLSVISGNDDQTLAIIASGGDGVISVFSNPYPSEMKKITEAMMNNKLMLDQELNNKYLSMMNALFVETSPAPVKYVMSKLGLCKNVLRLPLVKATGKAEELVDKEMKKM